MDLAQLLPPIPSLEPGNNDAFDVQVKNDSSLHLVKKSKAVLKITTINQWLTAFIRFVAVYTDKKRFQKETPKLMRYMEVIRDLESRKAGLAWLHYDHQIRTIRASGKLDAWDDMNLELWINAATVSAKSSVPARSNAPSVNRKADSKKSFRNYKPSRLSVQQQICCQVSLCQLHLWRFLVPRFAL